MRLPFIVNQLFISLCLVVVATTVVAQRVIKTDTSNYKTIRIDPSNASGGNVSDVFDEISYIPLETTPESLFGSIYQLEVVDDYFIILDQNTKYILLFDKNGKFHTKIKATQNQSGFSIWRFFVNRWTRQIVFSADSYRTIDFYDFDGKLVKHQELKGNKRPSFSYFIGPDKLISCDMYRNEDTKSKYYTPYTRSLIQYRQDMNTVYASGMHYTETEGKINAIGHGIGPLTYYGNDTTLFYAEYYKYKIYTVTPNTIKLTYKFIFPLTSTLSPGFYKNTMYTDSVIKYLDYHKDQISIINNCYKAGDNLVFEAHSLNYDSKERNLIYNLKSGGLIAYEHISPDEKSFFLPVYADETNFKNNGLAACDGKYIYTSMSSLTMFKAHEDNDGKNITYSPALAAYFKNGNRKDNPVILQFKLKDNL